MKHIKNNSKNMKIINLQGRKSIRLIPTQTVEISDEDYKEATTDNKVVAAWLKDGDLEIVSALVKKETASRPALTEELIEELTTSKLGKYTLGEFTEYNEEFKDMEKKDILSLLKPEED